MGTSRVGSRLSVQSCISVEVSSLSADDYRYMEPEPEPEGCSLEETARQRVRSWEHGWGLQGGGYPRSTWAQELVWARVS